MTNGRKLIFVLFLIAFGIGYRLMDYPANFTPLAAIALFCGFYFRKGWAIFIPLIILLASDFFIGFYDLRIMLTVYACLTFPVIIGWLMKQNKSWKNIIFGSLCGSIFFFLMTNFAVWSFGSWYTHNLDGLAKCYLLAIPFFRNTLAGDLFFSVTFFSLAELAVVYQKKKILINNNLLINK
jgi:hypothetical protein